ncbi:toll/interleukin-1 receptor domain-containing protein [Reticulibacter mediterranei]|nr:toll/interleukin-1 receptor domain-containing protein [Reticulibacter mediterranei]
MEKHVETIHIFYCYDDKDKVFVDDLEKHLVPLKQSLNIHTWWEALIRGGADRKQELNKQLEQANIVLLLVSPDFLASAHCDEIWQQTLKLQKENKIFALIPIRIRPVELEYVEGMSGLQALPKYGSSISGARNKDKIWLDVRRGIVEVIEQFRSQPQQLEDVREGFLFLGFAPLNGYRWDYDLRLAPGFVMSTDLPEAPWLVSEAIGREEISRRYSLFREENVLRKFANLPQTTDAIKQFADQYGELGTSVFLYYPGPASILWSGEALQFWVNEISEMHLLVTVWEMIQSGQIEKLTEHILWKLDTKCVAFVWKYPNGAQKSKVIAASENIRPSLFYQFEWGEVIKPALYYLSNEVEEKLKGHVNPTLSLAQRKLYMVPDSLLSALYVLLLLEVHAYEIEHG